MFISLAFTLGLAVGSFLNVVVVRKKRGESARGRSYCEGCKTILLATELIPILSFILQKGRCRTCGIALSWQYPIVEFSTAAFFGLTAWLLLPNLSFDPASFILCGAIMIGVSASLYIAIADIKYQIIPDGAIVAIFLLAILRMSARASGEGFINYSPVIYDAITAFLIAFFFWALWFFSSGTWMGFGDVKLILATSLVLGFPASLIAFLLAFWLGGLYGIILIISRVNTLKGRIPFGPFILAGMYIAYFFSENLLYAAGFSDFF